MNEQEQQPATSVSDEDAERMLAKPGVRDAIFTYHNIPSHANALALIKAILERK